MAVVYKETGQRRLKRLRDMYKGVISVCERTEYSANLKKLLNLIEEKANEEKE